MSPKSFIQFHQEGRKISGVQVRCPQRDRETERPGPRGDPTSGGSPKNTWRRIFGRCFAIGTWILLCNH